MRPTDDMQSEMQRNIRNYDRGLLTAHELINDTIDLLATHHATISQISDCVTLMPECHREATGSLLRKLDDGMLLLTTSTGDHRIRDEIVADAERRAPDLRRIASMALPLPIFSSADGG